MPFEGIFSSKWVWVAQLERETHIFFNVVFISGPAVLFVYYCGKRQDFPQTIRLSNYLNEF